jgi:hypothetical protein
MRGTAMADLDDLAARVTALEMERDLSALPSSWPSLTEAEKAGFVEALAEARERNRYRILNAPLNPDEVRQLLRECVTVVKPGEVLFFRCPDDWTVQQARDLHECVRWWLDENAPTVKVMIVPDVEMAVVQPGAADGT